MTDIAPKNLAAVTFDVGGTLLHPAPSVGHVYAAVAREFGWGDLNPTQINHQFSAAWKAVAAFDYSRPAWRALVNSAMQGLLSTPVSTEFFDAVYHRFESPDVWRLDPAAAEVFAALRRARLKLGVISNWDERLRPLLQRIGIASAFDTMAISHEMGATKPSPIIYQTAARQLGVSPEQILHLGDRLEEDYHGPRGVGFQAILLRSRNDSENTAIPSISALSELVALLKLER